jgi:hypothetical protein
MTEDLQKYPVQDFFTIGGRKRKQCRIVTCSALKSSLGMTRLAAFEE